MPLYHIGCSPLTNIIYAGTLNKEGDMWRNKTDVTEEAVASVRDHFESMAVADNKVAFGYEWTKKDGTVVQLILRIVPPEEE